MALPPPTTTTTTTTTDPDSLVMTAAKGNDGDENDSRILGIENEVGVEEALKVPVVEIASVNNNGDDEGEDKDAEGDGDGDRDRVDDDEEEEEEEEEEDDDDNDDGWEDEDELSLFEELIDGDEDEDQDGNANREGYNKEDRFSPSESLHLRKRLRLIGEARFLRETIGSTDGGGGSGGGGGKKCTAKKLCTAFGLLRPPFFLEGAPDEAYYTLLSVCISRELRRRVKLQEWNTVDDAVELLKGSGKVVVLTGAGVCFF